MAKRKLEVIQNDQTTEEVVMEINQPEEEVEMKEKKTLIEGVTTFAKKHGKKALLIGGGIAGLLWAGSKFLKNDDEFEDDEEDADEDDIDDEEESDDDTNESED